MGGGRMTLFYLINIKDYIRIEEKRNSFKIFNN